MKKKAGLDDVNWYAPRSQTFQLASTQRWSML